ncbi:hypothetical protein PAMA_017982 [Pampus argenteus]
MQPGEDIIWLTNLLSRLPEEACRERAVSRVLKKLRGFAEQRTLRVRPQLFLKVLGGGGLEPWELCVPELCVAIQIAVEPVVQMPREEYDAWLCLRLTLPPQHHCDPDTPGEPQQGQKDGYRPEQIDINMSSSLEYSLKMISSNSCFCISACSKFT